MQQLGALRQHTERLAAHDAQVIMVFREDEDGASSMRGIREQTGAPVDRFTLVSDFGAESSAAYSRGERTYKAYIVDEQGVIRDVLTGTTTDRVEPDAIFAALSTLDDEKEAEKGTAKEAD